MSADNKPSLTGCLATLAALPLLVTLRGYVLRDMWRWFVVPLGVPPISVLGAIGLSMMITLLTYQRVPDPDAQDPKGWAHKIILAVLSNLSTWGIGYFIAVVLA